MTTVGIGRELKTTAKRKVWRLRYSGRVGGRDRWEARPTLKQTNRRLRIFSVYVERLHYRCDSFAAAPVFSA